jgi:predicted AAA+ superfamily ATPase
LEVRLPIFIISKRRAMLADSVERKAFGNIRKSLKDVPVTAILGPRQCGKTTVVKMLAKKRSNFLLLDMENPADIQALQDPAAFFDYYSSKTICIDEIQRKPELFPIIRYSVDKNRRNGRFIILGSASPQLIKQSSESLAGRIRHIELTPFLINEISDFENFYNRLWLRGGFPRSFLAKGDENSFEWRNDFVKTFLERDIPQLGFNIGASKMRRVWTMLAHANASILNRSKLGESLGVSHHTINSYLDILSDSFMLRVLPPYEANIKKRLVKSPKILFRDSGILHNLLGIKNYKDLRSNLNCGSSYEAFAIEQILSDISIAGKFEPYFYRSHQGEEIDLLLDSGDELIAIECKSSSSPDIPKGLHTAVKDLNISRTFIAAPVEKEYPAADNMMVCGIQKCIEMIG